MMTRRLSILTALAVVATATPSLAQLGPNVRNERK
jgi:hypothetical protein